MKGLVFGAGFLGNRIAKEFGYELSDANALDLLEVSGALDDVKPDVVVNCVGKTGRPNIDWCETHHIESIEGNIIAPLNISTACATRGIYFVHIGSGCIYDGNNGGRGFSEEDEPNFYGPQFYAKTKIDSERALKMLPGLLIRIRMPIDDRPNDRNLIDKLLKYPKVIDIPNSMTTVPHMLKALDTLVKGRKEGVYNVVNSGGMSAARIMGMYQKIVDENHKFEIMSLDELDRATLGKRSNCILSSMKLMGSGIYMPSIDFAVRECLLGYKDNKEALENLEKQK